MSYIGNSPEIDAQVNKYELKDEPLHLLTTIQDR